MKYCCPLSTKRCICLQRKKAMGFEYLILFTYLPKAPAVLRYLPFVTQTPWKQVQFCRSRLFESSEIQHADAQSRKCFFANIEIWALLFLKNEFKLTSNNVSLREETQPVWPHTREKGFKRDPCSCHPSFAWSAGKSYNHCQQQLSIYLHKHTHIITRND